MRALSVLIRFYLSIEDGERVVARDLGELTECQHAHNISGTEFGGTAELADDAVILKRIIQPHFKATGLKATHDYLTEGISEGGLRFFSVHRLGFASNNP